MINARVPMATTRLTEGWANGFVPRSGSNSNGTRIMIRLSGVPEGARVFAPDGITGTGSFQPTQSGGMGSYPASGVYTATSTGSLLLARVRAVNPDGSGGYPGLYPSYQGALLLTSVAEADSARGTQFLVYETMDANTAKQESAQIPIWIALPSDRFVPPSVVRQTLSLAPLSNEGGSIDFAPVPRYRPAAVATDCTLIGDCAAPYFPKLAVTGPEVSEFTAPAGSRFIQSDFRVNNTGGGLLEWRVTARYRGAGAGWIDIQATTGFESQTIRFNVWPTALTPGRYEGEIVVQQVGSPAGPNSEVLLPIALNVTPAAPPAIPLPSITAIADAANRWPLPAAPGSLIIITGMNFGDNTSFTIGGKLARIVLAGPGEMLVEVPLDVAAGRVDVIPANSGRPGPAVALDIVAVAPSTLFVLNSDDENNSEVRPAGAGKTIQVYLTGVAGAAQPLNVKIHDRALNVEVQAGGQPGVSVVKFTVPADLPAMQTAVVVCAAPAAGGAASCSHPKDIWIQAAAE